MTNLLRRAVYFFIMVAAVLLVTEGGARVWLSVRRGDAGFLTYPRGATLAAQTVRTRRPGTDGKAEVSGSSKAPRGKARRGGGGGGGGGGMGGVHYSQSLRMNSPHFRGRALTDPQQARWRFAAMGGSSTFCPELAEDETWPEQLAARINRQDGEGSVEAINLGKVGASIDDVSTFFRDPLLGNPTEVVLIQSAFNNTFGIKQIDLRWESAPWHRALLYQRSLAYTVFFNGLKLNMARWNTTTPRLRATLDSYLRDIVEQGRAADMRFVFVLQPLLPSSEMRYPAVRDRIGERTFRQLVRHNDEIYERHAALLAQMQETAEQLGVAWVDPRPALLGGPSPQENFWVHLHLSALGAERLSAEIDAQVRERYGGWSSLP